MAEPDVEMMFLKYTHLLFYFILYGKSRITGNCFSKETEFMKFPLAEFLYFLGGGGGGGGAKCVHTYIHTYFILFGVLYMVHQHCVSHGSKRQV